MKKPLSFDQAVLIMNNAHAEAHAAMERDFPLEAIITYKLGTTLSPVATIIGHGIGLRVRVRGHHSLREYWIDARRVTSVLSQSVERKR